MAFGEHWEWRGFGDLSNALRTQIQKLTPQYAEGMSVIDQYLWVSGCKVNVKVREKDLKFKYPLDKTEDGFEKWRENASDVFPFPLNSEILAKLESALGTIFPNDTAGKSINTLELLLSQLPQCTPPVTDIAIEKFRTTYLYSVEGVQILVELADIKSIEIDGKRQKKKLTSVGLELENADVGILRTVRDALWLPDSLQVKGYLQLVEDLVQITS